MEKVYIVASARTPIGKMGGTLSSVPCVDLASIVIKEVIKRAKIKESMVEHVSLGCVIQAGLGQNVARQASLKAGLSDESTAQTINIVCGSGMSAIASAMRMIQVGDADIVIAGGAESMSNAPFVINNARFGVKMGYPMGDSPMVDTLYDALWDAINDYHMGITAENVAEKWHLTRNELDEFSAISHKKAAAATNAGFFNDEIVPVTVKNKKNALTITSDECIRPDTSIEKLSALRPVFTKDGLLTAGNSSPINDGAAAVLLMSEKKMKELNVVPEAEIIGTSVAGVDPAIMGVGPIASAKKILMKYNVKTEDIDLFECNEAFSSQSIVVQRELNIPNDKLNVNGGAIALGHPVGASGCRIIVTLINALKQKEKELGLASLCIGGGMGYSALIRRIK